MNKVTTSVLVVVALAGCAGARAQVSFGGNQQPVCEETPARSTGLDKIYVLNGVDGVSMSYTATSNQPVTWLAYGEQGGGYAQEIGGIVADGQVTTLPQVVAGQGYIIEEGTTRTYVWVTDYSKSALALDGVDAEAWSDCGTVTLNLSGTGDDMPYYSITGVRHTLDREITIDYYTLQWDSDNTQWVQTTVTSQQESFKNTVVLAAPLCNTSFLVTGDKYLAYWGQEQSVESGNWVTGAVDAQTIVRQELRENDNEKGASTDESDLGGSAPVTITFTAYPTDAVVNREWQMATDGEFEDIELRLAGDETVQTITEAGSTYWRYVASNERGECEYVSDTYTVNVGESELVCPNVFSPGSTEGVNDVWKVSYKSIVEFDCHIFNTWGIEVAHLTQPSDGWDGTYKGHLVDPGVYYYVLTATGSDGVKYKKSGDINILRYKRNTGSSSSTGE